ncbi:MAG: hypothetical protein WBW14_13825 [Candidatus Acidiferrum sp.]
MTEALEVDVQSSVLGRLLLAGTVDPNDIQKELQKIASVRRKMHLGLISLAFSSEISLEVLCLPRKI